MTDLHEEAERLADRLAEWERGCPKDLRYAAADMIRSLSTKLANVTDDLGASHETAAHWEVRAKAAEARLAKKDAAQLAAEELAEITEACLRMIDHALTGTGKGDMAITPDHSLTLTDGWKRLAALRAAMEDTQ